MESKYDIEGFQRRIRSTSPVDIITISSDNESDTEETRQSRPVSQLDDMPLADLRVKKERLQSELRNIEFEENSPDVDEENIIENANALEWNGLGIQSPKSANNLNDIEHVENCRNMANTPMRNIFTIQSPESGRNSSGIGSCRNTSLSDIEDDYSLDLRIENRHLDNMNHNFAKPKVQYTTKSATQKPSTMYMQRSHDSCFDNIEQTVTEQVYRPHSNVNQHDQQSFENWTQNSNNNNIGAMNDNFVPVNDYSFLKSPFCDQNPINNANQSPMYNQLNHNEDEMKKTQRFLLSKEELDALIELEVNKKLKQINGEMSSSKRYYDTDHPESRPEKRCKIYKNKDADSFECDKSANRSNTVTSNEHQTPLLIPKQPLLDYNSDSISDFENTGVHNMSNSDNELNINPEISVNCLSKKSAYQKSSNFIIPQSISSYKNLHRKNETNHNLLIEPRNTDKNLYLNSEKAKTCPLCKRYYKKMVPHFKTHHENSEVYVSRISREMTQLAKAKINGLKYTKNSTQYLRAVCVFCERSRDFMAHYWPDHMRSHTGEYVNECLICSKNVSFYSHCGAPTMKKHDFSLYKQNLHAYLCRKCNFIQIDKSNLLKHLEHEHKLCGKDIQSNYKNVIILPSLNSLPMQSNPNDTHPTEYCAPSSSTFISPNNCFSSSFLVSNQPSIPKFTILQQQIIHPANSVIKSQAAIENAQDQLPLVNEYRPTSNTSAESNLMGTVNAVANVMNQSKTDPEEVQSLLKAYETNGEIVSEIVVRPWMEGDYAKKATIDLFTQFALYKCMYEKCLFATNSQEQWELHMTTHIKLIDVLTEQLKNEAITKAIRKKRAGFRECSYCNEQLPQSNYNAIKHMHLQHLRSAFQCQYCFYRCNEMDSIVLHYKGYHQNSPREILLCFTNNNCEFEDQDIEALQKECSQYVKKLVCGQGAPADACKNEFVSLENLINHVLTDHNTNVYTCPFCYESVDADFNAIKTHLVNMNHFESHELAEFQCIQCKYGFDNIDDIREHMSNEHSNHYLFIAARYPDGNDDDAKIIYIGGSQNYSEYTLFKCANLEALNFMDPSVLNVRQQMAAKENNFNLINLKERYTGHIPQINYFKTSNFSPVTYEEYISERRIHSEIMKSPINNVKQDPVVKPLTLVPPMSPKMQHSTEKCVKSNVATPSKGATSSHLTIRCICISDKLAKDLKSVNSSSYKGRLCDECSTFIKSNVEYFSHLMAEPHIQHTCTGKAVNDYNMLKHMASAHSKNCITYLCEEKSSDLNIVVYKLVISKFECSHCQQKFNTLFEFKKHHRIEHVKSYQYLRGTIVQEMEIIESNDPKQPNKMCTEQRIFQVRNLFFCDRPNCKLVVGTKSEAIEHHNKKHTKQTFEVKLMPFYGTKINTFEDNHYFRMYVFECSCCMKLYDSKENVEIHIDAVFQIRQKKNEPKPMYTIKKLFACPEDNIISTFTGINDHYLAKHPNKFCTPVNIFDAKLCGNCNENICNTDKLAEHYQEVHPHGEHLSFRILRTLQLDDINKCKFRLDCCNENATITFQNISQVILHISTCKEKLTCFDCEIQPNIYMQFSNLTEYAMHRIREHNENFDDIYERTYNFKHIRSLLLEMQIIFPNGFMLTKKSIGEQTKLCDQINDEIKAFIVRERENQNHLMNT